MNLLSFTCIWFLFGPALAQTFNLTIDSTTCIAPSDFNTCYAAAVGSETACITVAGVNQDAILACGCVGYIDKMNCFASACWNRIYGCEYQSVVAQYFDLCPLAAAPVPYWPAPDNAPGGCSCNTGEVLEAYIAAEAQSVACLQNATSMTNTNNLEYISKMDTACGCCATGITISAMYDICPNTDPKLIGLNLILSAVSILQPWPSCGPSFQQFNCVNDLRFEAPLSTGSVYNPTNTPASGTQTLSNLAGEVTSPASGSVFSYSAAGSEWTVTAISVKGKQATTTKGEAGTAAATQGSGTATATSASRSSTGSATLTTEKSGVEGLELSMCSLVAAMMICAAMLS